MVRIRPINIQHNNENFVVYPRVELITSCISYYDGIFEILSHINKYGEHIDPCSFFEEISVQNTHLIYQHAIDAISKYSASTISLNVNTPFLNSNYLDMLIVEFNSTMFALELSENTSVESAHVLAKRINVLRTNPRVNIWLDDFGSKNANFDLTSVVDFDAIKVSKELFWDLFYFDNILLERLIKRLKGLASKVIIEGVDTFEKYTFCKEQGCLMQGYYFNDYLKFKKMA